MIIFMALVGLFMTIPEKVEVPKENYSEVTEHRLVTYDGNRWVTLEWTEPREPYNHWEDSPIK